jgi:hypothetical protein
LPVNGKAALGLALAVLTVAPLVGSLLDFLSEERWDREVRLASGAEVEGEPTTRDRTEARAEAGGESASAAIRQTPVGPLEGPAMDRTREISPLGPADAELRLAAGPVVLEGPGNVSPAFPARARLAVDADDDVDEAWLRLDGQRWTKLAVVGEEEGRQIHLGRLAADTLPAGETTRIDTVLERDLGPETRQVLEGPGWAVHADRQGPPAPSLTVEDASVDLAGPGGRFEAQTRAPGASWRAVPVEEGNVTVSRSAPVEVRARALDWVGNPGPWSPPVTVEVTEGAEPRPGGFALRAPVEGQRLEGRAAIDWRPSDGSVPVEVRARADPAEDWRSIGRAAEPPIRWDTGFVRDGDWQLHVRADEGGSWTSRLVTVHVDNLEPVPLSAEQRTEPDAAGPGLVPRTSTPLSAALASGAGLLALVGLVGRAWKRRPK